MSHTVFMVSFAYCKDRICHRAKQVFRSVDCSKGLSQILFEGPSVDPTKEKRMNE